jgi:hypothetical protein
MVCGVKSRGAGARGSRLTFGVVLWSSKLWAQAAESLPPPPPPPPGVESPPVAPGVEPPAAAPNPQTVPPTLSTPTRSSAPPPSASLALVPEPSASAEAGRAWYGWQLLLSDFVAFGSVGGAVAAGVHDKTLLAVFVPAAIVYDLGGPTIHWLHHRRKIAGASFGVRAGVPGLGVFVGMALASCDASSSRYQACRSLGGGLGALGGFVAASALDAALFGWDAPKAGPVRTGLAWAPTLTPLDGGAAAGVVGTF